MNKTVLIISVAAVAAVTGCKDPSFKRARPALVSDDVRVVPTDKNPPAAKPSAEIKVEAEQVKKCSCLPGTKHTEPCKCAAADCKCIVETKEAPLPPPQPQYTVYVVKSGDYLAKVSRKFNVTIAAIKNANSLKSDVIRVGQKLKIPGVSASDAPAATADKPAKRAKSVAAKPAGKAAQPYTGSTKDYVVKSGDTLGAIAYGSGINIRQLKAMNSLSSDSLKVGQKLKIPAAAVKKEVKSTPVEQKSAKVEENVDSKVEETAVKEEAPAVPATVVEGKNVEKVAAPQPAPAVQDAAAPKSETTFNYTVSEGEDITGVTIRWGVSAAKIRELNNLAEDAQLKPGQVIKLPAEVQQ